MKATIAITFIIVAFVVGKYHRSKTTEIRETNKRYLNSLTNTLKP